MRIVQVNSSHLCSIEQMHDSEYISHNKLQPGILCTSIKLGSLRGSPTDMVDSCKGENSFLSLVIKDHVCSIDPRHNQRRGSVV